MNSEIQARAPHKAILFVGVVLALGPVWGLVATVMGKAGAMYYMKTEGAGQSQEAAIAEYEKFAFAANAIGILMLPFGIWLIIRSVRALRKIK